MSASREGQELQEIRTEEPSRGASLSEQASKQASDAEPAKSREHKKDGGPRDKNPNVSDHEGGNLGRGWKIFRWFQGKLKLGDQMAKLKRLKAVSLIQNNSVTFRNLVVAAGTGGLQHLLNAKAFNCPESGYQMHGYTFLFFPSFILFCVNVLVIGEIWKLTSRRYVNRYHRRGDFVARLIPSLLKACVGPAVWLIVAFLEEDYYLCARLGPFPSKGNETSELEMTERKQKIEEEKHRSHVWAWIVLVGLVACGTIVVVCKNCFIKDNILINNNFEYERREALGAMKRFIELMNSVANSKDTDPTTLTTTTTSTTTTTTTTPPPSTTDGPVDRRLKVEYAGIEEKIKYYKDGVPEKIGRETVDELFEGHKDWKCGDEWHYIKAFEAFKRMYPRISTGSPLDPWRAVEGDEKRTQQKTPKQKKPKNPWEWKELQPLNLLNEKGTKQTTTNLRGENEEVQEKTKALEAKEKSSLIH